MKNHIPTIITGGPHLYANFTNAVPTYTLLNLCTCKWGIFALVESLEQSLLHESQNPGNGGDPLYRFPRFPSDSQGISLILGVIIFALHMGRTVI
jgi:hypothetical protein